MSTLAASGSNASAVSFRQCRFWEQLGELASSEQAQTLRFGSRGARKMEMEIANLKGSASGQLADDEFVRDQIFTNEAKRLLKTKGRIFSVVIEAKKSMKIDGLSFQSQEVVKNKPFIETKIAAKAWQK